MQKLSPQARARKRARDLAYAKTTDRKRKKAENQQVRHRTTRNLVKKLLNIGSI